MKILMFISMLLVLSCGVKEDSDCPDTIIMEPDVPDWNPAPPDTVSWVDLQRGALETDCLSCHRGDRSFSSEALFRASAALDLITSGAMPKGRSLTPAAANAFGGFFSQPVTQTSAKGED